jgi:ABC-type bacteriocin/lantibiotic exporter with double-glycine peptidase domain
MLLIVCAFFVVHWLLAQRVFSSSSTTSTTSTASTTPTSHSDRIYLAAIATVVMPTPIAVFIGMALGARNNQALIWVAIIVSLVVALWWWARLRIAKRFKISRRRASNWLNSLIIPSAMLGFLLFLGVRWAG